MNRAVHDSLEGGGQPLVLMRDATIVRPGGQVLFRGLSWAPGENETWAAVGPVGSGKTSLTEVLLGRQRLESGTPPRSHKGLGGTRFDSRTMEV